MAGTQTAAIPITVFKVIGSSDAAPLTQRLPEKASLTLKFGTPVALSSGYLIVRTTIDGVTKLIAGFSDEPGHNLASDGTAPIGGSGITYGSVQNQSSAKNIPIGAPMADGKLGCVIACNTTVFQGVTDDAHTTAVTDVGSIFGLTLDSASGQWFVDTTITSAASGACLEVVEVIEMGVVGGKVAFKISPAYQQLSQ